MKRISILAATLILGYSSSAFSAITTYTDRALFLGAVGSEIFVIDFDGLSTGTNDGMFAGAVDFGSPEAGGNSDNVSFGSDALTDAGSTTAVNGVGPIGGDFLAAADPVFAFSLDFLSSGQSQTISIFNDLEGDLLPSVSTPSVGFFGLISDTSIDSFLISNGEFAANTRDRFFIDNFSAYSDSSVPQVPVPAAIWLFGTALIGFAGFGKRKKEN